ncbi:10177_t:CDS:1 [Ambispora leptoticha]|uniref:10177_t:CDS:1 n=1 Tax=Ambispora leptoticha TaxID=144679 RepID=A0A9N8ZY64_9GLOM|nr:10177_t:CDS:1 [Ambispora leptoticha]
MRVIQTTNHEAKTFAKYLLRIGNGAETIIENDLIRLPNKIIIHLQNDQDSLIDAVYPNLTENALNTTFITERTILIPLNNCVDEINKLIMTRYPGEQHMYHSFDSVPDDYLNLYPIEYLNSLTPQDLPPHELTLKVGASIMLLRNLDPTNGFCNGKDLSVDNFKHEQLMLKCNGRLSRQTCIHTQNSPTAI